MQGIETLIVVSIVMFVVLGAISVLAHIYNLNNIKAKTVGDGQHGTARWARKGEIEKIIGLLLLLSKDECRKSLNEVSWDEIYEMLIREYIPHADNGNTEIRIRQIATDMNELAKVYEIPSMFNEIEIFTKPILKTAMDCIRLINYLERKEKPCKESKR